MPQPFDVQDPLFVLGPEVVPLLHSRRELYLKRRLAGKDLLPGLLELVDLAGLARINIIQSKNFFLLRVDVLRVVVIIFSESVLFLLVLRQHIIESVIFLVPII